MSAPSPAANHVEAIKSGQPSYFLVRPNNGNVVPLIPADQLPLGWTFVNVSCAMDIEATIGMLNLGVVASDGGTFDLQYEENGVIQSTNRGQVVAR